jgi:hypothetical protein
VPQQRKAVLQLKPKTSTDAVQPKRSNVPLPCPLPCPPGEVQERNQKLITELKRIMQNDATGLTQFRAISGEYQQGLVTPMQYYQVFQVLKTHKCRHF